QRTFKKSFTSFSHSTRNKTRDGLIRVRNIRALNGRFNTSITHAYSIVIGSKHITLNATGGGFLTARSEERFSRNAETDLVCRLLLEKKKIVSRPGYCISVRHPDDGNGSLQKGWS